MAWYNSGTWHGGIVPMQDLKVLLNELRVATSERSVALGRGAVLTWPAFGPVGPFQGDPSSVSAWVGSLRARLELLITPSPGDTKRFIRYATGEPFANLTELLAAAGYTDGWVAFLRPQTCVQALYQIRACLEQLKWFEIDITAGGLSSYSYGEVVSKTRLYGDSADEGRFDTRYPPYPTTQQSAWEGCLALPWPATWDWMNSNVYTPLRRMQEPYKYAYDGWVITRQTDIMIGLRINSTAPTVKCTVGVRERNRPVDLVGPYGDIPLPYTGYIYGDQNCRYPADQAPLIVSGGDPDALYASTVELGGEAWGMVHCIAEKNPAYNGSNMANYRVTWQQVSPTVHPFATMPIPYSGVCATTSSRTLQLRYTDTGYRVGKALSEITNLTYG